jgi:imidazolonepropionase-like amidohydrolase
VAIRKELGLSVRIAVPPSLDDVSIEIVLGQTAAQSPEESGTIDMRSVRFASPFALTVPLAVARTRAERPILLVPENGFEDYLAQSGFLDEAADVFTIKGATPTRRTTPATALLRITRLSLATDDSALERVVATLARLLSGRAQSPLGVHHPGAVLHDQETWFCQLRRTTVCGPLVSVSCYYYPRRCRPPITSVRTLPRSPVRLFSLLPLIAGLTASPDSVVLRDSLRLYYVGYPVGWEHYQIAAGHSGLQLSADFSYVDRGRRTHLTAAMQTRADYTPLRLEILRLTDTGATVDTRVEITGRAATVLARDVTSTATLPATAFAISAYAPVSQHLMLLRYWLAHGRPPTMAVVPGGPTNPVSIRSRGRDTLSLENGAHLTLDRYSVNGVAWGGETVWIDAEGRLAGIATRAGNLTFEAVRGELQPQFSRLMSIAARDRVAELEQMSHRVRPMASGTIAFTGATLIDGTGRAPIPDATIVVSNGRIIAAGPRSSIPIPAGAHAIRVDGKTIAPGLWDMHTHLMQVEWAPVYLAAGITTVRDMGNELELILPFRDAVESSRALGPHILLAGLVDGGGPNAFGAINATTPDEGRAITRRYHELGFEQMKLYDQLKPAVVGAIIAEAHALGMTVTGHVPRALGLRASIDSGMDQIAHQQVRGEAGSDSVRRAIAQLKAHGTVMDPTMSWNELNSHSTMEPVAAFIPGVNSLPPVLRQRISAMGSPTVDSATAHQRMTRALAVVKEMHDAGVPIVPGTDEGVPGFSVYRELELYAAAGFTPMEALQAGTSVSARAMRLDNDRGTIEPGRRADLIVLDANPMIAMRNIRSVKLVMKDGVLYKSADIWRAIGFTPP